MSEIVHTVKRGTSLMAVERKLHELKGLSEHDGMEINTQNLISFTQNFKLEYQYTGSDFTNSFMVDRRIFIVGAGFLGPRYVPEAKYSVKMRLEKLWKDGKTIKKSILATVEKKAQGIYEEIFNIDFDYPVEIDSSALKYTIAFRLMGPETMGLDPIKMKSEDTVEGVRFKFWPGSQQMPNIRFTKNQPLQ